MARFLRALDFSHLSDHPSPVTTSNLTPAVSQSADHIEEQRSLPAPSILPVPSAEPSARQQANKESGASSAKAVRLLWCDTAGIRRCRAIPGHRYASSQSTGVGITTACMAMPAFGDAPVAESGLSAVGEARMKPVDATRVDVPWRSGHQMALVEFEAPRALEPWDYCPRNALKKTCKMLLDNFGLELKVGFEIEFLLLERVPPGTPAAAGDQQGAPGSQGSGCGGLCGTPWRPVNGAMYCKSSALDLHAGVLDDMVSALEQMGIEVLQWHAESAHGQFEIALGYGDPVEAADKLLLAREALVGVAGSHGLAVSFMPKPIPGAAGSACHVHLSLWKDGKIHMHVPSTSEEFSSAAAGLVIAAADASVIGLSGRSSRTSAPGATHAPTSSDNPTTTTTTVSTDAAPHPHPHHPGGSVKDDVPKASSPPRPMPTPSPEILSFLAGLLTYLDVLLPWTAPSPNSYARLVPGAWAGAHTAWGYNNRETPLRMTAPGPTQLTLMHLEYKPMDNTANPYLALCGIIVAGMLGLFARLKPSEPCQVPPQELDEEAAARLGVRRLPTSLQEALTLQESRKGEAFKAAVTEAIGAKLLTAYLAVRQAEARQAASDKPSDMLLRYS